ncbi:hypothetical protein ACFO1B_44080 [Dactylosporangium siamense]|uniref:Nuclear transport factor 2 family protein n=1 Tax=Dactylosporangium siamense TaxID=685454 RepID=A0A919UEX5_9ACTN|nr:hypothetical protein [Dactylosporangium siamense]GIG52914.1 hypothetical protein Dsi01nite_109550 [Dactylosporangium siamense]
MNHHIARYTVTASVLLAVTAAALTGCSSHPRHAPTTTPAVTTAPTAEDGGAHQEDDGDDGAQPDTSTTANAAALDVISAFMTAWARPGLDQRRWHADVARYTSPTYADKLATVDPAGVPATQVTTAPAVRTATAGAVVADVGTDAGPITVTCVRLNGRWLVVNVEPPEPHPEATP